MNRARIVSSKTTEILGGKSKSTGSTYELKNGVYSRTQFCGLLFGERSDVTSSYQFVGILDLPVHEIQ